MRCPMLLLCVMKCREPDHNLDGRRHCHNTVQSQFALHCTNVDINFLKWPQDGCLWRTKPMKLVM